MFIQIALGSTVMFVNVMIAGLSVWAMETALSRSHDWLRRPPHRVRMSMLLSMAALWVLAQLTLSVWIWAFVFSALGLFPTLETSVYFSLVTYTTLGFGDVLLPLDWRLLAGMASANGLVSMGILTAALVELVRQIRVLQRAAMTEEGRP